MLLLTISPALAQKAKAARAQPTESLGVMVERAALEAGISPHLLWAVVEQESRGKWWVVSPKGAAGLGQLMPATAARFGVRNPFNPQENLRGSARYLRYLLDYFNGDVRLALAGYNAGEGAVDRFGRRIPPFRETQNYVAIIYPRFVKEATAAQSNHVQTIARTRQNSILTEVPVRVDSRALALQLANSQRVEPAADGPLQTTPSTTQSETKATSKVKGASVYFWPAPARISANLLPN